MFTSFRISIHDLESPTEAFLTNALVNILNSINIDVSGAVCDPDAADQRVFKIKLFQYINYMYRKLNKKKFLYFDLINPSKIHFQRLLQTFYNQTIISAPKKTLNLLQTLLNYVLYYNMVKDEVVCSTKPPMAKLRELTDMKQKYVKDNEQNKILTKEVTQDNEP